jgi:hypothetical protein
MGTIYRFLASYEGLIYILLALGALITIRWIFRYWLEWREAVFGLEREYAMRRLGQAVALMVIISILFLAELIIASFLAPSLAASSILATPTIDVLNNSGDTNPLDPSAANPTSAPAPGQITALGVGCIPDQLNLTNPTPGQELSATVKLEGTVRIENFGFYKYEVAPQGSQTWATISAGREVVINGELGLWDTSVLVPGDYQLRLIAIDNQGGSTAPCIIPVRIVTP